MEVNKFNRIELHDSDIDELYFDFAKKAIKIVASVYNETTKDYDNILMLFKSIEGFKLELINLIDFKSIEINYAEASQKGNNIFIEFTLLIDMDEVELSFLCGMIETDLSEELYLQHLKRD